MQKYKLEQLEKEKELNKRNQEELANKKERIVMLKTSKVKKVIVKPTG